MTSLKVTLPDAETASRLEMDIHSAVYRKLAEVDYKPIGTTGVLADGHYFALEPHGQVHVEKADNIVTVKLTGVDADRKDVFTGALADLEQRNDGLTGEID
jgi:hypothetical protein